MNPKFIKFLLNDYAIVFVNETWSNNKNKFCKFTELDEKYFRIVHISEREHDEINKLYSSGHCPGGIYWIINKQKMDKLKIKYKTITISERIIYVKLNETAILGTYLPSNDQTIHSKIEMHSEIEELNNLLSTLKRTSKDIIIVGDQNTDLRRNNDYDKIFLILQKLYNANKIILILLKFNKIA